MINQHPRSFLCNNKLSLIFKQTVKLFSLSQVIQLYDFETILIFRIEIKKKKYYRYLGCKYENKRRFSFSDVSYKTISIRKSIERFSWHKQGCVTRVASATPVFAVINIYYLIKDLQKNINFHCLIFCPRAWFSRCATINITCVFCYVSFIN